LNQQAPPAQMDNSHLKNVSDPIAFRSARSEILAVERQMRNNIRLMFKLRKNETSIDRIDQHIADAHSIEKFLKEFSLIPSHIRSGFYRKSVEIELGKFGIH